MVTGGAGEALEALPRRPSGAQGRTPCKPSDAGWDGDRRRLREWARVTGSLSKIAADFRRGHVPLAPRSRRPPSVRKTKH